MKSSNFDGLSSVHSPQSSIFILQPQISLIQPQSSIFISCPSILRKKNGTFDSKSPQNSVISNKMFASAACTACSFFQVCSPYFDPTFFLSRIFFYPKFLCTPIFFTQKRVLNFKPRFPKSTLVFNHRVCGWVTENAIILFCTPP